jgi:hypothetical protein
MGERFAQPARTIERIVVNIPIICVLVIFPLLGDPRLMLAFPALSGLLAAAGLWRRRRKFLQLQRDVSEH